MTGSVVDEDDLPVALARIALESETGAWRVVRATSGEDGSFRLAPVSDGEYTLRVEKEGHATTELKGAVRVDGRSIDDLEVRLRRGARIHGRILGLDFDELARVEIRAEADEGRVQEGRVSYDGRYEIADLPPGHWRLRASLPAGSREAAVRVVLEPGIREVTRDLEFGTALAFSGQVLYGDEPLTGASVSLTGHDVTARRSVVTDYQGRFEIRDLEPGRYRLQVSSGRHGMTQSEDLELVHDLEKLVEIASARLRGRVVEAESGEPIPEALILLRRLAGGGASDAAFLVAVGTDADGAFDIPRVTPGRYSLTARKDGYAADERILPIDRGADLDHLRLPLAPTTGLWLDVHLASGQRPRFVTASVLDPAEREVTFQSRSLDDDGIVRFPTIPPGTWTLLVSAPGGATTEVVASVPGEPIAVVLPLAGPLRLRVPELVTSDAVATLTLTDSRGRIFRGNTSEAGNRRLWPVVGGRATVPSLPPGVWTLTVAAPDGRAWNGSVVSTAGTELRVACAAGECHAVIPLHTADLE